MHAICKLYSNVAFIHSDTAPGCQISEHARRSGPGSCSEGGEGLGHGSLGLGHAGKCFGSGREGGAHGVKSLDCGL